MSIHTLGNGGTVIVRAGQLAGVGPVGPPGAMGPAGPQGLQGITGEPGPAGFVIESYAAAAVSSQSVGPSETITVAASAIITDSAGWWTSFTEFEFEESQAFNLSAWVVFEKPANDAIGYRELLLVEQGVGDVTLARMQVPAVPTEDTVVNIATTFLADVTATYVLKATSTDALSVSISEGRITLNRIGAGPAGPQGPQGETGPVGPAGPTGATGPNGNANSGFNSFDDL